MLNNDFETDTKIYGKKEYFKKVGWIFFCAIFLSGVASLAGIAFLIEGTIGHIWTHMGAAQFAERSIIYLVAIVAFITLVKIAVDEKPLSKTIVLCVRIIGILFVAGAVGIPRLSGYHSSGFEIFSNGSFVLFDGWLLLTGLFIVILSILIKAGFDMQKEINEIL